jgi:tRNA(adenine34) deaminase
MQEALKEARQALEEGEVPVGAVIVLDGRIIGRGHNRVEALKDPTAHAEILAIGAAATYVGNWRLSDATLYVTVEPCAMCAGAIVLARLNRLVFGVRDPKSGACGSVFDIVRDHRLNHWVEVIEGVLAVDSGEIIREMFKEVRGKEASGLSLGR